MNSRWHTIAIRLVLGLALATMVVLLVIPVTCARPSFLDGRADDEDFFKMPDVDAIVRYDSGAAVVVNQLHVVFKTRPSPRRVERLARSVGGRVVGQELGLRRYLFEVPTRTVDDAQRMAAQLEMHSDVDYATPLVLPPVRLTHSPEPETHDGPATDTSR